MAHRRKRPKHDTPTPRTQKAHSAPQQPGGQAPQRRQNGGESKRRGQQSTAIARTNPSVQRQAVSSFHSTDTTAAPAATRTERVSGCTMECVTNHRTARSHSVPHSPPASLRNGGERGRGHQKRQPSRGARRRGPAPPSPRKGDQARPATDTKPGGHAPQSRGSPP